jgi:hypothetical protein
MPTDGRPWACTEDAEEEKEQDRVSREGDEWHMISIYSVVTTSA